MRERGAAAGAWWSAFGRTAAPSHGHARTPVLFSQPLPVVRRPALLLFLALLLARTHSTSTPPTGSLPNGGGQWCFNDTALCIAGSTNCASGCQVDASSCSTGQAANSGHTLFCKQDAPAGSLPNGAGSLCFNTSSTCLAGPNNCGAASPCVVDPAACSTGQAEYSGFTWFCPSSLPLGSVANGGGCVSLPRDV